jgi:uncharacterized delta-60 repeat protein
VAGILEQLERRCLLAAVGAPDPTFAAGGVITIPNEPFTSTDVVTKAYPDGRFLIARVVELQQSKLTVTRCLANGQVDTSFGGTGGSPPGTISPGSFKFFRPRDMEIDSAGRIYLSSEMSVLRLTPGGTIDVNFGGISHGSPSNTPRGVAVATGMFGTALDMALAPDGRIGLVGTSGVGGSSAEAVMAVFNSEGTVVPQLTQVWVRSFGGIDLESQNYGGGAAAAFTPDGGFLTGGFTAVQHLDIANENELLLIKWDRQGHQVWDWHGTTNNRQAAGVGAIALQGDGRILVNSEDGILARLSADGTLLGSTSTSITGHNEIAQTPDGRFYLLGDDGQIIRMTPDGSTDATFPRSGAAAADRGPSALDVIGNDPLVQVYTDRNDTTASGINADFHLYKLEGDAGTTSAETPRATRNSKGTLQVRGTSAGDTIQIYLRHRDNRIIVRVNGEALVQSFSLKPVKRIQIFAGAGDDTVTISPGVAPKAYIEGAAGDDTITAGDGYDYLTGGDGNDQISGGGGGDAIFGDAGDDQLFGNGGRDVLHGGDGDDALFGGPTNADQIFGDAGADSAAKDARDSYESVEEMLS